MKQEHSLLTILKHLYNLSGFRMSLYDPDMKLLGIWPEEPTPFCALIQENAEALCLCHKYDSLAAAKALESGESYLYRCHMGLYEAVAPLYHFGVHAGYLMMGQTLDTSRASRTNAFNNARAYAQDLPRLTAAVELLPERTEEQILSCISILEICAEYLSLHNYLTAPDKELPSRIRTYLNANYTSPIQLDTLCREFYLSRSTLTSCFRSAYNRSIMDYVTELRMKKARELLCSQTLSIREIASSCGFHDQNYFTKVFQKYYKQSPSRMRRDAQADSESSVSG